jgi:hypothetical protein
VASRGQHEEHIEPVDKEVRIDRLAMTKCKVKKNHGREESLIFGFIYHVMNSTCIHLRTRGLNIYMYMKEKIYKEPYEEIQKYKRLIYI